MPNTHIICERCRGAGKLLSSHTKQIGEPIYGPGNRVAHCEIPTTCIRCGGSGILHQIDGIVYPMEDVEKLEKGPGTFDFGSLL